MLILTSAFPSAWLTPTITTTTPAMRVASPTMQLHHQQQTYAVPRDAVTRAQSRGAPRGGVAPTRYSEPSVAPPPTPTIRSTRQSPGVVAAPQTPAADSFIRVQGGSIKTWKYMSRAVEQVQVLLTTEGRPLDADVELWNGPGNIPAKMRVYVEDGQQRPFKAVIATPRGPSTVAISNVGELEFPFDAQVVAENVANPSPECRESAKNLQGGATRSYQFDASVDSVQVLLFSEGMPLNARVELIQGPDNNRQVIELYTDDGADRPFFCFIETPGPGSVVRVINTAPLAYPLTSGVIPHSVGQGSPYDDHYADDVVVVGGSDEMRLDRYTQRAREQQQQQMHQHQVQMVAVERARRQQAVAQQQAQENRLAVERAAALQREAAARAQQQQAAERAAAVQLAAAQVQQQQAADRAAALKLDAARAGQAAGRAAAAAQSAANEVRDAAVRSAAAARSAYERHTTAAAATALVAGPTSAAAAPEAPPLSEYEKYLSSRGKATPTAAAAEASYYDKYIASHGVTAGPEMRAPTPVADALSREAKAKQAWIAGLGVPVVNSALRGAPVNPNAVPVAPAKPAMSEYERYLARQGANSHVGANFGRG